LQIPYHRVDPGEIATRLSGQYIKTGVPAGIPELKGMLGALCAEWKEVL